jgi:hypothetical protein
MGIDCCAGLPLGSMFLLDFNNRLSSQKYIPRGAGRNSTVCFFGLKTDPMLKASEELG